MINRAPRAPVTWTSRALLIGTLMSALAFAIGFVLTFAGESGAAAIASAAGILVLLATPAVGLVLSAAELRRTEPQAAALALAVLAVLAVAVGVALLAR